VATKPRLWAAVQRKLDQLARMADVSSFDYLCERIDYLEQEVSRLRTEIGRVEMWRGDRRFGLSVAASFV
jgi:hypothetical protein